MRAVRLSSRAVWRLEGSRRKTLAASGARENARDLGDVDHPNVVGEPGPHGASGGAPGSDRSRVAGFLPAESLNGSSRERPAGAGQVKRDGPVARESGDGQALHHVADDVGETADRRDGLQEGAHRPGLGSVAGLLLPAEDGSRGDAEGAGGVFGRQGQEAADPEDAEAGLGGVVGPLPLGDLAPPRAQDLEGFIEKGGVESLLLDPGESSEGGITRVPALAQALGQGQAQEVGGPHQRPEGQGVQTATFHDSPQQAVEIGGWGEQCNLATWPGGQRRGKATIAAC